MSGQRRLFREGTRKLSTWRSDLNFGLIAMVLLTTAAVVVTWKFPELTPRMLPGPRSAST
jgi:hypothetical protein